MREQVLFIDTNKEAWKSAGPPGIYTKLLSRDEVSGERTALNRLVPEEGMAPPSAAHYHHTTEELFIVKGCMSFDSKTWLTAYSYCFHPPETVHGFKSQVKEETWFLSHVGCTLDFNYVENPEQLYPYYVSDNVPSRECSYHSELGDVVGTTIKNGKLFLLSSDPNTGEGSFFGRFNSGWCSGQDGDYLDRSEEMYVLSGTIKCTDNAIYTSGCYCFEPQGSKRRSMTCTTDAIVYLTYGPHNNPS
jgi:hypothetical protein